MLKRLFSVTGAIRPIVRSLPSNARRLPAGLTRVRAYLTANDRKHVCHLYHLTQWGVRWYRWHTCFLYITTIVNRLAEEATGACDADKCHLLT